MRRRLWTLLALLTCVSGEYLMGGHLDNNARSTSGKIEGSPALEERGAHLDDLDPDLVAEESTVAGVAGAKTAADDEDYEDGVPRYRIPYPFAFNGGEPFSLEKDPITGEIDFEKAPPVKALNYTSRYQENEKSDDDSVEGGGAERERITGKDNVDVGPNEINTYTPNFHDFLNLPVHYSSDKYGNDKYPLISSSYANTKVQSGANSYSVYNHRPYHTVNSDVHARPTKGPYAPMTKTSTYKTTTAHDYKAKWTTARPSTPPPTVTTVLSTKAPVITTWKPSSVPTAFHSIDREEDEKNILPIEELHAAHRHPGDVAKTQSPSGHDVAPVKEQTDTRYKDQPIPNFVLSHARPAETKPPAQNEEYGDSYDTYELSEGEVGDEEGGNNEETDYLLFQELLKDNATSTTTTSRPTTPKVTTTASTSTTTTATSTTSTAGSSTGTTTSAAPSVTDQPSRSTSTLPAFPKDTFAGNPLQFQKAPQHPTSFSVNDHRQSVAEPHDGAVSNSHGSYRPNGWMIKPDGTGTAIESTSNIVVPPDQDTVTFVLGNRQNVEGGYYSVGTAVGENPYGSSSDIQTWAPPRHEPPPPKDVKYEHPPPVSVTEPSPDRVTQKWRPPAPSALKAGNEVDPVRSQGAYVASATSHDTKKEKNSGYVVFPDDDGTNKRPTTEEHVVIVNEADGSIRELPPRTTVTTTVADQTKLNLPATGGDSLPQLAEDLTPPDVQSSKPPSSYHHYQFDAPWPDHLRPPQRPPLLPRVKPHPPGLPISPDAGLRKPYPPDVKLPNILPQFRPNAKASHGHRGPDAIGTMPAGLPPRIRQPLPHPSSRRPLPPPPPSYLLRLSPPPPPPPIHAIRLPHAPAPAKADGVAPSHEAEQTIRRFRPAHGGPPIPRGSLEENPSSKLFGAAGQEERNAGGEANDNRKEDRINGEAPGREDDSSERYSEEPPMTPPRPPMFPKRRTADHPRVTTLQMIQHHGELGAENEDVIAEAAQPVESALAYEPERRKSDDHRDSAETAEQPVYVVYPVTTAVNIHPDDSNERDGSVVVGTLGPQRPLPPDTLLQDEQEKTHTVYSGRPVAPDFPYPLERPDPSSVFPVQSVKETPLLVPSDQRQPISAAGVREVAKNEQDAANVIPYLPYRKKSDVAISVTLHRASPSTTPAPTPTPIAYVYTPTQAAHRLDGDEGDDDAANVDAKQPVLLPSQQPSSSSSSAPAPQNFMAPFVPSLSAEAPSRNGWSVVVVEPPEGAEKRQDGGDSDDAAGATDAETQTEKEFDAESFKPQFFGGFKPLYEFPPGDTETRDANTEMNMPRHARTLSLVT